MKPPILSDIENLKNELNNKADEQWYPDDWKNESDLSLSYPDKSITYFLISTAWNNGKISSSSVIKTIKHNNYVAKQETYRSNGVPLFYRTVNTSTLEPQWGEWQTISTATDLEQKADNPKKGVYEGNLLDIKSEYHTTYIVQDIVKVSNAPPIANNWDVVEFIPFGGTIATLRWRGQTSNKIFELIYDPYNKTILRPWKEIATSINLEQKADKQWMPWNWRTYNDLPSTYPANSTTVFEGSNFAGFTSCIVETVIDNQYLGIQTISASNAYGSTKILYRLIESTNWGTLRELATKDKIDTLWSGNISLSTTPQTITVSQDLINYDYLLVSHGSGSSVSGGVSDGTSAGEFMLKPFGDFSGGSNIYTYIHGVKVVLQRTSETTISIWSSANLILFRRIKGVKVGG